MNVALWRQNKTGNSAFVSALDALSCVLMEWKRIRSDRTQSSREKYFISRRRIQRIYCWVFAISRAPSISSYMIVA